MSPPFCCDQAIQPHYIVEAISNNHHVVGSVQHDAASGKSSEPVALSAPLYRQSLSNSAVSDAQPTLTSINIRSRARCRPPEQPNQAILQKAFHNMQTADLSRHAELPTEQLHFIHSISYKLYL
jgi:hypothetical protein